MAMLMFGGLMVGLFAFGAAANARQTPDRSQRLVTIHDGNIEKSVLTEATSIKKAFEEAKVPLSKYDLVEPGLGTKLTGSNYEINLYRARPVKIVDGKVQKQIMSPYRTSRQIVEHAGMKLYDEDVATLTASTDPVASNLGLTLTIERSTPFRLVLYGEKVASRTMASTVGEMLKEKDIKLGPKDTLSKPADTPIKEGMTVEIWRNGVQTQTREEKITMPVRQIEDPSKKVGYKEVKTVGAPGKKMVTYEVVMKNGKEIKRKVIQSVTTKQPREQVEIVGTKPSFSGDFSQALAKLRSCEGGYDSWNPAGPYYGAYQFDKGTWSSVSNAPYGDATPAEQDAAAHALYQRRGWQPWPHCGASLPDIYR